MKNLRKKFELFCFKNQDKGDVYKRQSVDIPGKLYFFLTVLEFHMRQLLSFHRSFGVRILYHIFFIPTRGGRVFIYSDT